MLFFRWGLVVGSERNGHHTAADVNDMENCECECSLLCVLHSDVPLRDSQGLYRSRDWPLLCISNLMMNDEWLTSSQGAANSHECPLTIYKSLHTSLGSSSITTLNKENVFLTNFYCEKYSCVIYFISVTQKDNLVSNELEYYYIYYYNIPINMLWGYKIKTRVDFFLAILCSPNS